MRESNAETPFTYVQLSRLYREITQPGTDRNNEAVGVMLNQLGYHNLRGATLPETVEKIQLYLFPNQTPESQGSE